MLFGELCTLENVLPFYLKDSLAGYKILGMYFLSLRMSWALPHSVGHYYGDIHANLVSPSVVI